MFEEVTTTSGAKRYQSVQRVSSEREKIHRPQTRRRRENDVSGYEKLLRAKDSLVVARAALQLTQRREMRKFEIFEVERAAQKLLIDLRHEPKSEMERIEKEAKKEDEERAKKELPELPMKGKNVALCDGNLEIFKANDNNWAIVTEPDESEIIAANKREKQALLNKKQEKSTAKRSRGCQETQSWERGGFIRTSSRDSRHRDVVRENPVRFGFETVPVTVGAVEGEMQSESG